MPKGDKTKELWKNPEYCKKMSEAHKGKHSSRKTEFKKGQKFSGEIEFRRLLAVKKVLSEHREEKSYAWRGDKVKYRALHSWVQRKLGKPSYCAYCQKTYAKRYEWANKSRAYKRDLSDWIRLCKKCHIAYDKGWIQIP